MSQEERRQLKARRFCKFEETKPQPQVESKSNGTEDIKRVNKRPNTELNNASTNNKKMCYGLMRPPSSTVNLANNRMKKLKKYLQDDLKTQTRLAQNSITSNSPEPNLVRDIQEPKRVMLDRSESPDVSNKNIYTNLQKWKSLEEESSSKNSANEKLNRLKKVLNQSRNECPNFSGSFGAPNYSPPSNSYLSTPLRPPNLPYIPISNVKTEQITCKDDLVITSEKTKYQSNLPSTSFSPKINTEKYDNFVYNQTIYQNNALTTKEKFSVKEDFTGDPYTIANIKKSTSVSSRILKIRNNTEKINNSVNSEKLSSLEGNDDYYSCSYNNSFDILRTDTKTSKVQSDDSIKNPKVNFPSTNLNTLNTSTPLKKRLKLKRNFTPLAITSFQNTSSQCSSLDTTIHDNSNTILTSERLKLKRTSPLSTSISSKDINQSSSSTHFLTQESLTQQSTEDEIKPDTNEYNKKMAMTANWIRDHKQFVQSPQITNNYNSSLNVSCTPQNEEKINMDTSEEMEWSNAELDDNINNTTQENQSIPNQVSECGKEEKIEKDKNLCIVVDTNIFISDLSKLEDIIKLKIKGSIEPVLYIPWMVIIELDELKDKSSDNKLKQKAFNAIKFINKYLSAENSRVKGQSVADMGYQKHVGSSPDDKIIGCCFQALKKYESVVLLSNDINLKNKALINNIPAAAAREIIMKIMSSLKKCNKTEKVMQKMSILCSELICECAKEAYGEVWSKMDVLSNPPWTLLECLKRFKKYWVAVFKEKVMKQFLTNAEKLRQLINSHNICDDSDNYIEFVKLCLNLCIFLKDMEEYRGSIENTISDIIKIS